jgi:acyl-CoA thioesterase FadM
MPIMNACTVTYIREVKPFQKFDIKTKMIGWDEKYYYIEQRFESENTLHAVAYVRGVFIHKGRRIEIDELLKVANFNESTPELPEPIMHWKMLLDSKKKHHS